MVLGVETDTQDATGAVTRVGELPALPKRVVEEAFRRFEGEIEQTPPAYSALKHEGTPLYKFARRGTPIQKAPRRVFIERLEILEVRLPEIGFEVTCSGGTYVRTLCADIGRILGCGGHLKTLRRLESSGFGIAEAVPLQQLEAMAGAERLRTLPIPMAEALRQLPAVAAEAELMEKIRHGRKIAADDLPETDRGPGPLKVLDGTGRLLAVIERRRPGGGYNYCVNLH
jgi:tRNA pseudouridine55 synthase